MSWFQHVESNDKLSQHKALWHNKHPIPMIQIYNISTHVDACKVNKSLPIATMQVQRDEQLQSAMGELGSGNIWKHILQAKLFTSSGNNVTTWQNFTNRTNSGCRLFSVFKCAPWAIESAWIVRHIFLKVSLDKIAIRISSLCYKITCFGRVFDVLKFHCMHYACLRILFTVTWTHGLTLCQAQ